MKKRIIFKILISFICLCVTSCYVESGNTVSKKLERIRTNLNSKYVIENIGFHSNEVKPNTDLFQKRGSNEFTEFYFYLIKQYHPKEINIKLEIINPVYKFKKNEHLYTFKEIKEYNVDLYYVVENNEIQRHYISYDDRKLGYAGGTRFFLCFPEPVKARQLEYIEFDLSITDEDGNVYNHHLHYDVSIKPVFKMGSTLWEYWSGI